MSDHIDPMTGLPNANHMLYMRIRRLKLVEDGSLLPWRWMEAYADDTVAYVGIVSKDGTGVMIPDDPRLFPSDALLAQIQLIVTP